jgi:hypothetical protein
VDSNIRIDMVVNNIPEAYKEDSSFFKANPSRSMNIRLRLGSETPSHLDIQTLVIMPSLWMLVWRMTTGIHKVEPIWIGNKFWSNPSSDNEMALIVAKCSQTDGLDHIAFDRAYEELCKYHAEKNGTVK